MHNGGIAMKLWLRLIDFGYRQALSCLFPAYVFLVLAISNTIHIPYVHRYDLLLILCLLMQWVMYHYRIETRDEVKVILVFHLIGLALEIYKVHMGSWSYPEEGWTKWFGVPLYSGFMYASVASYMCQAWRRLDLQLFQWPRAFWVAPLGAAIYFNFFTHHYIADLRWVITGLIFVVFFKTRISFKNRQHHYRMPLVVSFMLIGFFIWIAENIATFLGAWQYPNQREVWDWVHVSKISSWFLLVIVSFIIVAQLKHVKALSFPINFNTGKERKI
jgi:uncharacterized membrane protein YoaT (DUF817 family)